MADWQEQVARGADRYRELRDRLAQTTLTETDGLVTVTVSASGLLKELTLDEPWNPVPLADVSARIMACLAKAQARIPDVVRQAMADTVGDESSGAQAVLATAQEKFPPPPPPERGPDVVEEVRIGGGQERRPREPIRRPARDEDWDERPFLEDV
jgi:hypothetical protein